MSDTHLRVIPCHEAVKRLWDYLDSSGPGAEHADVEAHLALCRRCCGELEFIKHLRELLSSQTTEDLPSGVNERLERFLEEL